MEDWSRLSCAQVKTVCFQYSFYSISLGDVFLLAHPPQSSAWRRIFGRLPTLRVAYRRPGAAHLPTVGPRRHHGSSEAFNKNWSGGPQNSNVSTFFWKYLILPAKHPNSCRKWEPYNWLFGLRLSEALVYVRASGAIFCALAFVFVTMGNV